jgi:Arc/MetJ-type ribon-helix-helix transcriptional regulator
MRCTVTDTMVRVPRALQERYERLEVSDSWKSFPAFVREAVRQALDKYEKSGSKD